MEEALPHGPLGLSPLFPSLPTFLNNPSRRRSRSASLELTSPRHSLSPASPPRSCEEVLASYGMAPLSFSMDDQHEDPSCHHVTTSCKECETDHGLCCVCTQPGMRARYAETMQALLKPSIGLCKPRPILSSLTLSSPLWLRPPWHPQPTRTALSPSPLNGPTMALSLTW